MAVHGDLRTLALDGVLVPGDRRLVVEEPWRDWVSDTSPGAPPRRRPGAARVVGSRARRASAPVAVIADVTGDATREDPAGEHADRDAAVAHLRRGVHAGLDALCRELGRRCRGDDLPAPVVGVPLLGTGGGGFARRRGSAIRALLDVLDERRGSLPFDVVVVCRTRSDYSAVQSMRRHRRGLWSPSGNRLLDRLAGAARDGTLALLFGAGVSVALGVPTWTDLLGALLPPRARRDGLTPEGLTALDAGEAAAVVSELLPRGTSLHDRLRSLLEPAAGRCSVAHAELASLRAPLAITTNYDAGYEIAMAAVLGGHSRVRVLPWDGPGGPDEPLLVKLHGDVERGSIVLSREQFLELHAQRRALTAPLQERMLTGTVLGVGTSFSDTTLTRAAAEVRSLQTRLADRRADSRSRDGAAPSTVLLIPTDDPPRRALLAGVVRCVDLGSLLAAESAAPMQAGRAVEVFLDELALRAGAGLGFLADPAYADLSDGDRTLCEVRSGIASLLPAVDAALTVRHRRGMPRADDLARLRDVLRSYGAAAGAVE